jgi:hypothetical protein
MQREGMLVDQKCHELAVHFLNRDATDAMKSELAEWIQWQVELWLYDDIDVRYNLTDDVTGFFPIKVRTKDGVVIFREPGTIPPGTSFTVLEVNCVAED